MYQIEYADGEVDVISLEDAADFLLSKAMRIFFDIISITFHSEEVGSWNYKKLEVTATSLILELIFNDNSGLEVASKTH